MAPMFRITALVTTLALAGFGCGDNLSGGTDGGDGPDGSTSDAGGGADAVISSDVLVTYRLFRAPVNGAIVVFHDVDGTVLSSTTTNDEGQASTTVPAGGYVTLEVLRNPPLLLTWTDVGPGDRLLFDAPITNDSVAVANVRHAGAVAGNNSTYLATSGCSIAGSVNPDQSIALNIRQSCITADGTYNVLGRVTDAGNTIAVSHLKGIQPAFPNNITLPAWDETPDDFTVTVVNLPSGPLDLTLAVAEVADGVAVTRQAGAFVTRTFGVDATFADFYEITATANPQVFMAGGGIPVRRPFRFYQARVPTGTATSPVDGNAAFMDVVRGTTVDATTPQRPVVTIDSDQGFPATDMISAQISWRDQLSNSSGSWIVVGAPRTDGSADVLATPIMPASVTTVPPATAVYESDALVIEADYVAGYAEFKQENMGTVFLGGQNTLPEAVSSVRGSGYTTFAAQP